MRMNRLQASLEGENYESLASNFEAFCLLCESLPVHNNARNDLLLRDRILSIFRDELASAISKYEVDQVFISLFLLFENSLFKKLAGPSHRIFISENRSTRGGIQTSFNVSWIGVLLNYFNLGRATHDLFLLQSINTRIINNSIAKSSTKNGLKA